MTHQFSHQGHPLTQEHLATLEAIIEGERVAIAKIERCKLAGLDCTEAEQMLALQIETAKKLKAQFFPDG
jgi:hypothetical protein